MSYPCGPNTLGKKHRMGGMEYAEIAIDVYAWRKIKHPNPGKINFRRSDPNHPGRQLVRCKTKFPVIHGDL